MRIAPWRSRSPDTAAHTVAAAAALRAATLLSGGVPAARVWLVLGEEAAATPELASLAARMKQGTAAAPALAMCGGAEWRVLAAAWQLAEHSGAPIALMLERIASALTALQRLRERRAVLLAGPRATIRLVATLPLVALLLSALIGFNPIPVLLSPLGALLAVCGCTLLLGGLRWARLLTDRIAAAEWVSGLECELCWIALAGGVDQRTALCRVIDVASDFTVDWVRLSALRRDGAAHRVLRAAAALGTPAGTMLLAEATAARARALTELEREAERLAVRILLPIGCCVLPSFMLLGVVPVLMAVLGSLEPLT